MLASRGSSGPSPFSKQNGGFQKFKNKIKNLTTSQKLLEFKDSREENQAGFKEGSENKVGVNGL